VFFLPVELDVIEPALDVDDVGWSLSESLVGDAQIAATGIRCLCGVHASKSLTVKP
jgi:hypothetical protein